MSSHNRGVHPSSASAAPVDHYENFPVASWLCPPRLRAPIAAIYWFARTADDIADEGTAPAAQRLADLAAYADDLEAALSGGRASARWPGVFAPLAHAIRLHSLPAQPLRDLLDAFAQDVRKTEAAAGYADRAELEDYCARSANPVGRLLLHLYGVHDAGALRQSDAICTALQLINFWQDIGVDLPRGRYYLPQADCRRHGLDPGEPAAWPAHPGRAALVRDLVQWARETMLHGAPLVHAVPGRAGWELRLVVQGGLRILDKLDAPGFDSFQARPRIRAWDGPLLLIRALRM